MSISLDPEKTLKLVRYDYLNRTVVPGQILFAGSSLMEQFPVHEFQILGLEYGADDYITKPFNILESVK